MGGSNQMVFLVGALIVTHGSGAVPILDRRRAAGLDGGAGLDRARPHVARACRRDRRDVRRGVQALQPGAGQPHGRLLLVGLGPDLRIHRDPLGNRAAPVVPAVHPGHAAGDRHRRSCSSRSTSCGVKTVTRFAIPVGLTAAFLALLSALIPIIAGTVDVAKATSFHLDTPFDGAFGVLTSAMAGLYLVGFAAPAFEAATCHVGEMRDPVRSLPRAVFASGAMAGSVLRRAPARLAGHDRDVGHGQRPWRVARADVRAAARGSRQVGRDLVHGLEHVHGHDAAARRRLAHPVAALRGRPAAALLGEALAPRRPVGRRRSSPPASRSARCSWACRPG